MDMVEQHSNSGNKELKRLTVFDISAIINSGTKANYSKKFNLGGVPTGGLYKLFTYISNSLQNNKMNMDEFTMVACMDSKLSTSFRKDVLPCYKGNRGGINLDDVVQEVLDADTSKEIYDSILLGEYDKLTPSEQEKVALASNVNIQLRICEEWLPKLGIPVLKMDGVEADDFIYSTVLSYPKADSITIFADDEDLFDTILYNPNTRITSVAGRGDISPLGLSESVLVNKIFGGCTSDNIPRLDKNYPSQCLQMRRAIYDGVVNPFNIHNPSNNMNTIESMNVSLFRDMGLDDDFEDKLLRNMYCVMPFCFSITLQPLKFNMEEFELLISTLRMKTIARRNKITIRETEQSKDLYYKFRSMLPVYTTKYFGSEIYK